MIDSKQHKVVSPSRQYVAVCNNINWDGHYFRKFTLPEEYENNAVRASWYFLNRLDRYACIDGIITYEDYGEIREV